MRKFFITALVALTALCGSAYSVDHDIIDLNDSFINNSTAIMKERAVKIFNQDYTVYIDNIKLNHNWFTANIIIKNAWDLKDYEVEQFCKHEDKNPDVHGNKSTIETDLFQNYDFMIVSVVHLLKHEYGQMEVVYTIHDAANWDNTFDLVLRFPYENTTVTAIDALEGDQMQPVEYFDLQGHKLNAPTSGIIIEKKGGKVSKKLYR
ncbi:MAG: hypothetical protein IJG81_05560 [Muribaculaceae bacterium]|nr:hypothetical protein [Muribaculaceae bacterium]